MSLYLKIFYASFWPQFRLSQNRFFINAMKINEFPGIKSSLCYSGSLNTYFYTYQKLSSFYLYWKTNKRIISFVYNIGTVNKDNTSFCLRCVCVITFLSKSMYSSTVLNLSTFHTSANQFTSCGVKMTYFPHLIEMKVLLVKCKIFLNATSAFKKCS